MLLGIIASGLVLEGCSCSGDERPNLDTSTSRFVHRPSAKNSHELSSSWNKPLESFGRGQRCAKMCSPYLRFGKHFVSQVVPRSSAMLGCSVPGNQSQSNNIF